MPPRALAQDIRKVILKCDTPDKKELREKLKEDRRKRKKKEKKRIKKEKWVRLPGDEDLFGVTKAAVWRTRRQA